MKLRASLVELWSRVFNFDPQKNIFSNGDNDQYSKEIEIAISNSATGTRARNMMADFIAGSGLTFDPDMSDYESLWDVVCDIAFDIATQGGCWVHRSFKINEEGKLVTARLKVLNYHKCRKGKDDDGGYTGKILYGDFGEKKAFGAKKKDDKWYYSYNDNQNVIIEQIKNDAKDQDSTSLKDLLGSYRGQVLYINTTRNQIYATSPFDAVYNDLDTEARISMYANKAFRSGFLGKLMVFFSGLSEEDAETLEKDVQGWLGSENSDNVYIGQVDDASEVDKSLLIKQVPSQYNDDMSQNTEKRITRNILGAAKNLPEALVFTNDNALFGGSGEMIRELKKFYNEQTSGYRSVIEKNIHRLGINTQIIPLGETVKVEKEVEQ